MPYYSLIPMPGLQGPGHNNNMGLAIGPENVTWLNFKNYMMVDSHQLAGHVEHQHTHRKVQHYLLQNNYNVIIYIINHNINIVRVHIMIYVP